MRLLTLLFLLISSHGFSQNQLDLIDVQCYRIQLAVNDQSDSIFVQQAVEIEFLQECSSFYLDLHSVQQNGNGMTINAQHGILENGEPVNYHQSGEKLFIEPKNGNKGTHNTYIFSFGGIPDNGLIIGQNKFGNRTFFGDNWPNRAHHWFACVDHPADKATVNFTVIAPKKYECIATGVLKEDKLINQTERKFVFESSIPLPTKVMVVGIADFAVQEVPSALSFPISSWVYPEDSIAGFYDMSIAPKITAFFVSHIGSYPYEKLANVQSTTMFGGMENAGNIFYDENAVKGKGTMEALIAHEIAHQWFGNSASEEDWKHLWLSEGFATYFTNLYFEFAHGDQAFKNRLSAEREKVIGFHKKYDHPVIDTTYTDLMILLNANSYQKGAWFLHMLRTKVSTEIFWKGIRSYYETYQFSNASSDDFQKIMENVSGMDLDDFFDQWLRTSGHPILKTTIRKKQLFVEQTQQEPFSFPLEVLINFKDGSSEIIQCDFSQKTTVVKPAKRKKITSYVLDPNVNLLFEEK